MKNIFSLAILSSALFASANAFADPQSYPLVCRGSTALGFSYNSSSRLAQMSFVRGTGPSSNGVAAGSCTWIDRAVGPNEPSRLCHFNVDASFSWRGDGRIVTISSGAAPYLSALRDQNQTFILQVFNDGAGCFRVTRLGP